MKSSLKRAYTLAKKAVRQLREDRLARGPAPDPAGHEAQGMMRAPEFAPAKMTHRNAWSEHIFIETPNYVLDGYIYDTESLTITFEHAAGDVDRRDPFRHGWGAKRFRNMRASHLAVKPRTPDWYRNDDLVVALTELREAGFFDRFDRCMTYGGSMGGFAALAFADLVKATTVLAMTPQTTLNLRKVPWENRFKIAQRMSWRGEYADAVGKSVNAKKVIVIVDPFVEPDLRHVQRLKQDNLHIVNAPFLGHGIALPLTQLKALGPLITNGQNDELDLLQFHQNIRRRKSWPRYLDALEAMPRVAKSANYMQRIKRARARLDVMAK